MRCLTKSIQGLVLCVILFPSHQSYSQIRGEIIKPGDHVLDPNQDGFVSKTTAGFSSDGYYPDEFELRMFGIPILGDGEALNDIQAGALCGTTDIAVDTAGYGVYAILDNNNNLIFRFRLAGDRTSVEAYTILIDTDQAVGSQDPNSTAKNPGFEIDITLIKNSTKGVLVYDLDGIDNCPSALLSYPFDTHYQKSIAGTESCDDPDYFYDFYVPMADLEAIFGITVDSELRFVGLTNVSATCAMGGQISDIAGVDDNEFDGCNTCIFEQLSTNQCPTSVSNLCGDCEGFLYGTTPRPIINSPVKVGEEAIKGTGFIGADIFVQIYNEAGALVQIDTTLVNDQGAWSIDLNLPLQVSDSVTARARSAGSCNSGISESDLSFVIVVLNQPPTLSGLITDLIYTENDPATKINPEIVITDPDNVLLDSAWVWFSLNYNMDEDLLLFSPSGDLTTSYNNSTGLLAITGQATLLTYQNLFRSIKYMNNSEDPDILPRNISFAVHDGIDSSNVISRAINIISVNDPPVISGASTPLNYTIGAGELAIDNSITVSDVDDIELTGGYISISSNYFASEDVLGFRDQNGITGAYNATDGVITISGTASLADYSTFLQTITYQNNANPIELPTRRISFIVNDGEDNSLVFDKYIDMPGNNAPIIIDEDSNMEIDTIFVSTNEDVPISICIYAEDPDGDHLYIEDATSETGNGTFIIDTDNELCVDFTPNPNANGEEAGTIVICDMGDPSLCDTVVVIIEIISVDDPPIFVDGSNNPIDTLHITTQEEQSIDICLNILDIEGRPFELTSSSPLEFGGTLVFDLDPLCFTYTPAPNFNGTEYGEIYACLTNNTIICDTLALNITVTPINDPPQISQNGIPLDTLYFEIFEDSITSLCVEATDPDGDLLDIFDLVSVTGHVGYETLPAGDLCFFAVPSPDFYGTEIAKLTICDNGSPMLCDTVVVVINVLPVNDPPDLEEGGNPVDSLRLVTYEDIPLEFCLEITDTENQQIELKTVSSSTNLGHYAFDSDCITFTPDENIFGIEHADLEFCDDGDPEACKIIYVTIDILPVNDAPIAVNDTVYISGLESLSYNLLANDYDIEGDDLYANIDTEGPSRGSLTLYENGDFIYVPDKSMSGNDAFVYTVCDSGTPSKCSAGHVILLIEDSPLTIYQALSPNGDGINDYWQIGGIERHSQNVVRIYDRYNNLVFEISGYDNDQRVWRGESNKGLGGVNLRSDTYFYVLTLGNSSSVQSGFVVLKRD